MPRRSRFDRRRLDFFVASRHARGRPHPLRKSARPGPSEQLFCQASRSFLVAGRILCAHAQQTGLGLELTAETVRVPASDIVAAVKACDRQTLDALTTARDRIQDFHRRQLPKDGRHTDALGVELGHRWTAIEAVGLYVPGGTAAYPSSVLMNAVPAKVAGVPRVVMVVPAPDGKLNPLVLAAARLGGVTEIYRVGGAQARP